MRRRPINADRLTKPFDPKETVADVVGVDSDQLPTIEQQVEFNGGADLGNTPGATYNNSGTYEIIWERDATRIRVKTTISSRLHRTGL